MEIVFLLQYNLYRKKYEKYNKTQYSHNHWIIFTFTIERLQVMAKRIMSKLTEQNMN